MHQLLQDLKYGVRMMAKSPVVTAVAVLSLSLGLESSCDETASALVRDDGEVLSDVVSSQIEVHQPYGGVVPELKGRE